MKHTYLLTEGTWETSGTYFDEEGRPTPVQGRTVITHEGKRWFSRGTMRLLLPEPREFRNDYEIDPLEPGEDHTWWKTANPAIGTMWGTFMLVEDSILSAFSSENEEVRGHEYFLYVDDDTYRNRGFSFRGEEKLSSWAVTLKRKVQES